jgi:lambda family phage portal protein
MGVEVDGMKRPVAYHFRSSDKACPDYYQFGGRGYVRVSANYSDGKPRILHMYRAEEVDQVRGFSGLASAIMRLKMLSGYEEATLVAARIGASQMVFFEQGEGAGEYTGDDSYADGSPIDEIEPGIARVLPHGWKAHAYDPKQPTTQYVDFTKQTLRGIAAGLGLSYITLANDLESVNYSSARVGVLEDREEWKGVQAWFVESLCMPVYRVWLEMALLRGKVVLPSGAIMPYDRYEKFQRVTWMPRRWDWVDPLKDMQANQLAVSLGVRSVSDIIRERGQDPEEVFAEVQREKERMKELGITPEQVTEVVSNDPEEDETADD